MFVLKKMYLYPFSSKALEFTVFATIGNGLFITEYAPNLHFVFHFHQCKVNVKHFHVRMVAFYTPFALVSVTARRLSACKYLIALGLMMS